METTNDVSPNLTYAAKFKKINPRDDFETNWQLFESTVFSLPRNTTTTQLLTLNEFFSQKNEPNFFTDIFPSILSLALRFKELFPENIKSLSFNESITLTETQVGCLLCHAFLCSFPGRDYHTFLYSPFSFFRLFAEEPAQYKLEKLKMFFAYFRNINSLGDENIHVYVSQADHVSFRSSEKMVPFRFNDIEKEEDFMDAAIVSSANKFLGGAPGGVFATGKMQEPIDFATHPEITVAQLLIPVMQDDVAVSVIGVAKYAENKNLGMDVKFVKPTSQDLRQETRKQQWINIDSVDFRKEPKDYQFTAECIERQLIKLVAGMETVAEMHSRSHDCPVATGIWGGDAFGGDSELIFVQMWLAASLVHDGLTELIWLPNSFPVVQPCSHNLKLNTEFTVNQVYTVLQSYLEQSGDLNCGLFEFLEKQLMEQ